MLQNTIFFPNPFAFFAEFPYSIFEYCLHKKRKTVVTLMARSQ